MFLQASKLKHSHNLNAMLINYIVYFPIKQSKTAFKSIQFTLRCFKLCFKESKLLM